jgi:hypothetical protein
LRDIMPVSELEKKPESMISKISMPKRILRGTSFKTSSLRYFKSVRIPKKWLRVLIPIQI